MIFRILKNKQLQFISQTYLNNTKFSKKKAVYFFNLFKKNDIFGKYHEITCRFLVIIFISLCPLRFIKIVKQLKHQKHKGKSQRTRGIIKNAAVSNKFWILKKQKNPRQSAKSACSAFLLKRITCFFQNKLNFRTRVLQVIGV